MDTSLTPPTPIRAYDLLHCPSLLHTDALGGSDVVQVYIIFSGSGMSKLFVFGTLVNTVCFWTSELPLLNSVRLRLARSYCRGGHRSHASKVRPNGPGFVHGRPDLQGNANVKCPRGPCGPQRVFLGIVEDREGPELESPLESPIAYRFETIGCVQVRSVRGLATQKVFGPESL